MISVSLKSQETLLKYIGGLPSYLRRTMLLFNPTNLDQVCVQAEHLEVRRKTRMEEKFFSKKLEGKDITNTTIQKKDGKKSSPCTH